MRRVVGLPFFSWTVVMLGLHTGPPTWRVEISSHGRMVLRLISVPLLVSLNAPVTNSASIFTPFEAESLSPLLGYSTQQVLHIQLVWLNLDASCVCFGSMTVVTVGTWYLTPNWSLNFSSRNKAFRKKHFNMAVSTHIYPPSSPKW